MGAPTSLLPLAVFVSIIVFPIARLIWCKCVVMPRKTFTRGDAAEMLFAGSGVPQALCLLLWPIWPGLLTAVTDMPMLLIPTGFISLIISVGAIFNWK